MDVYDFLDDPRVADMHFITPKFAALKGPSSRIRDKHTFPPEHFVPLFKETRISAVVRLNEETTYDAKVFTDAGLKHHDLFFDDCTVPSRSTISHFFSIASGTDRVAVHCKVGWLQFDIAHTHTHCRPKWQSLSRLRLRKGWLVMAAHHAALD